jgi:protein involved in polysaccharide export with SLBB domain/uncharacterized protein YlxW (UPF0749 family)
VWRHAKFALLALCVLFVGGSQAAPPVNSNPYRLGAEDKLRIRVYEWRDMYGQVHQDWAALNDEFTVGPSGDLSLPLIGSVPAAGQTIEAVTKEIADRLQIAAAMERQPKISVEVSKFRPFYILGAVSHPGEYPYRPGLTALQALGIAGGVFRPMQSMMQMQGNGEAAPADLHLVLLQYNRLVARHARLQAELDGQSEVKFPQDLIRNESDPGVATLLQQEGAAFAAHHDALEGGIASRREIKEMLEKEVISLQQKMASVDQEVSILKDELTKVSSLAQKGFEPLPRVIAARQNVMLLQRERLDLDTAMLRTKEEIGKTTQNIADLQDEDRKQLLRDVEETSVKLAELSARTGIADQAMSPAERTTKPAASSDVGGDGSVVYTIVRHDASGMHEIGGSEATLIQPGDTIRVTRQAETPVASAKKDVGANQSGQHASPTMARATPQ